MRFSCRVLPALMLAAFAESSTAGAEPVQIPVKVVDRTRTHAFIEPGGARGLRAGDEVVIVGRSYKIVSTSSSFAVVETSDRPLDVGAEGLVTLAEARTETPVQPISPTAPLSSYRDQWVTAVLPASAQTPNPVPLGPLRRESTLRALLRASASAVVPLDGAGDAFFRSEERALVHYEPIHATPFAIDGDVALENWISGGMNQRDGSESRPVVIVRQLEAGYGSELSAAAAAGRLRFASTALGMLDGARLRTPVVGGFSLSAFGGVVPDPLSAVPDSRAARFGAEATYDAPASDLQPHIVLGGHLSRFDGAIDERRLHSSVYVYPAVGRFGARGEMSFFDANNPWNADTVELSMVAFDAATTFDRFELGASAGMHRPERSRWLASFFPPEWLCTARPDVIPPGSCAGSDAVYTAAVDLGLRLKSGRVGVGGSVASSEDVDAEQVAGFGNLRLLNIVGELRLDAGAMAARGTLLRTAALVLSPGIELWDGRADVSLRYRPAVTRYSADTGTFVEHSIGPALWLLPVPSVEVGFDGTWIAGRDLNVMFLQASLSWRPET